jgi:hypothetical protein
LVEIILPDRLKSWVRSAFLSADRFPRLDLNPGRDCHELKRGHFIELVWLKSFFLHRLKFWVRGAFLSAAHFPRLHLGPDRNCQEKTRGYSIYLVWSESLFLHQLNSWARSAFLSADHFPRLDLNESHDCVWLAEMRSWESLLIQHFPRRNVVVLSKSNLFNCNCPHSFVVW